MTAYSGQIEMEYYPSGSIKSYVTLVSDEFQVGQQYIKVAECSKITFYPNGNIKSAILADEAKLVVGTSLKRFQENDRIAFLENGVLDLNSSDLPAPAQGSGAGAFFESALKFLGI